MINNFCIKFVNYFHLYVAFYPFLVNIMPLSISNYNTSYYYHHKIMMLLCFLVPSHWGLLNDRCIISIISEKLGDTSLKNNSIIYKDNNNDVLDNANTNTNVNTNVDTKDDEKKFVDHNAPFIEKYARPIYEKILNVFGLEWNKNTSQKLIHGYWFVNHIILWNFLYNNLAKMQHSL